MYLEESAGDSFIILGSTHKPLLLDHPFRNGIWLKTLDGNYFLTTSSGISLLNRIYVLQIDTSQFALVVSNLTPPRIEITERQLPF